MTSSYVMLVIKQLNCHKFKIQLYDQNLNPYKFMDVMMSLRHSYRIFRVMDLM